jgi:hypothetical protein
MKPSEVKYSTVIMHGCSHFLNFNDCVLCTCSLKELLQEFYQFRMKNFINIDRKTGTYNIHRFICKIFLGKNLLQQTNKVVCVVTPTRRSLETEIIISL